MDVIKAQSILIVPPQSEDLSSFLSAIALGNTLLENQKYVTYFVNKSLRNTFETYVATDSMIDGHKESDELIIKLSKIESTITTLDWKQTDDQLEINLLSEKGRIGNPNISFSHSELAFDLRIYLNMDKQSVETLSQGLEPSIFSGTSVYINDPDPVNVVPINVFKFLKQIKYVLSGSSAELLMKSLRVSTDDFKTNTTVETFTIAAELMKIISRTQAKEIVSPDTSPIQIEQNELPKEVETEMEKKQPIEKKVKEKPEAVKFEEKFATPEELPADYDPLSPATIIPKPFSLEPEIQPIEPQNNTPLPEAK